MSLVVPFFEKARVLVVGDLMLDRYWFGDTRRISPEAPVPVVSINALQEVPGGAANVALNIAVLGAEVRLSGIIGDDEAGCALKAKLAAINVDFQGLTLPTVATITKLRIMSQHQQLIRLDFEKHFPHEVAKKLVKTAISQLENCDLIILSDYGKGSLAECQELIVAAKNQNIPVIVDPKGVDFSRYKNATLLTPNLSEFEAIVGKCQREEDLVTRGMSLLQTLHMDALLITRGEQGMTLLQKNQSVMHLPAHAHHVFDVTGAGDTVVATLGAALAAKSSLENAVVLANLAASIVVTKLGTSSVSRPELLQAIHSQQTIDRGIVLPEQLRTLVEYAHSRGEKVVFTNGCFDIIHAGHVGYLQQAKTLGDHLIVAINDDDSVKRLKGVGRPINSLQQRMAVLASLECVDWVVGFSEDTPENLLSLIKPDLLVKGGDYQSIDAVVGAAIVKSYGGEVKVLDFVESHSTSAIISRLKTPTH